MHLHASPPQTDLATTWNRHGNFIRWATAGAFFLLWVVQLQGQESNGRLVIDWSEQTPGLAANSPAEDIYFQARNGAECIVVGPGSEPASPFGDDRQGIFIVGEPGTEAYAVVALHPFLHEVSPRVGWVEIEFVAPLNVEFSAGATSLGEDGQELCRLAIHAGQNVALAFHAGEERQHRYLSPPAGEGEPHTLRIAWDAAQSPPGLRFFLDGQPLLHGEDNPAFLEVDPEKFAADSYKLALFSAAGAYLGNVRTSEP